MHTQIQSLPMPTSREPNETPIPGTEILAVIQHWQTKRKRFTTLKAVDEGDCSYRTTDDESELSHDWNVIAWDYLPQISYKSATNTGEISPC